MIQRLNNTLPSFVRAAHGVSGALMVAIQTFLSAFGLLLILVGLILVEIGRVQHGIELFEVDHTAAVVGAVVLVLFNLTLEFVIHYVETKNGYHAPRRRRFSLRFFAQDALYFIGWSEHKFEPRYLSPAHDVKRFSRLLTFSILVLALAGSMKEAINSVDGNWVEGLVSIVTESTLQQLTVWASGLLFALVTVVGAQRLTAYVATVAAEVIRDTDESVTDEYLPETVATYYQEMDEDTQPVTVMNADVKPRRREIKRCENCNKQLPARARANQLYCSSQCRQDAYRKRAVTDTEAKEEV